MISLYVLVLIMDIKKSFRQTLEWLKQNVPLIIGVLFLVSMIKNTWFVEVLKSTGNDLYSAFFSDLVGSIMAGNPINSYIIAGEFWELDTKIIVITVFLVAWVTVGVLQIPAEAFFLGKRFAIVRNIFAFFFAVVIWYVVYLFFSVI